MLKKLICMVISLMLATNLVYSQDSRHLPRTTMRGNLHSLITGSVYDTNQNVPIEYANVILFNQGDSLQSTGTITNRAGIFRLEGIRPGQYYIEIHFMGYKMRRIDDISVASPETKVDLGVIALDQSVLNMESVTVEAEKAAITYEIDKKVINVDQMQTAVSGTAVDVLENVPSVTVDIEGNVSLRGSSNFMVLIDGRPTVLEGNDALQQTPASTIENIEIITNPSAKYDPDGTSGIINIILKKGKKSGRSGLLNLNGGAEDKYGGNFLLEDKSETYSLIFGLDYSRWFSLGYDIEKNHTTQQDITSFIYSKGDSRRGRISSGLRGAFEYNFNPANLVSIDLRYGTRSSQGSSEQNFDEWSDAATEHHYYISTNDRERAGDHYSLNMSYLHKFAQKGHEILSQIHYSKGNGDENTTNELLNSDASKVSGRISTEKGPSADFRTKVDYSLPLGKDYRFEAGYQSEIDRSEDRTGLSDFDPVENRYQFLPQYTHTTLYDRDTHSLYAIYSGKRNDFGLQGGLRGEYTYRVVELVDAAQRFTIDRWDYFPTVHLSYEFTDGKQMMASYTRRIDRPRGYYLEPFETWMDAYNVRMGNPAIKPEYIDSYELGYQTYFGKNLFSTELYYRVNHDKIERVRSVYDTNITLHSVANVGTDYAFGSELLLNLDLTKRWNINLMGNVYHYRIEGTLYGERFSRDSFNWSTRFNNAIHLGHSTQFQINTRYNSPTVSSQGRREGFFTTDLAVKQEFFDESLALTLQIRDVFKQGKHEYVSEGPDFYSYNHFTHESPVIMLNLKYNINNYKAERKSNMRDGAGSEDEF
ncbi:TonB-dependent receptor [candidate division KSB1 bacterium]|nr:TonB-dependent receptor [candidate division KSB1 bacterium]